MTVLNSILQTLVNGLLFPFRQFPIGALVLISIVTAVGMLLVFKKTSNQTALEAVKKRIHACLFEIRLFNDDLRAIFRAQFEILRTNLTYLRLQLVPLVFILPPMILLLTQLQPHYGYQGLHIGEPVLVKVRVADSLAGEGAAKPAVDLDVPSGLKLETPAVWIPSRGELAWRMVAEAAGEYDLTVHLGDESFDKSVKVSEEFLSRSPLQGRAGVRRSAALSRREAPTQGGVGESHRARLPRGSHLPLHAPLDVDLLRLHDRLRLRLAQADEGHDLTNHRQGRPPRRAVDVGGGG